MKVAAARFMGLLLFVCSTSPAEERHLTYQNLEFDYEWVFNDLRMPFPRMEEIAAFAPNAYKRDLEGRRVLDWWYIVGLDDTVLERTEPFNCRIPDAAFLRNAASNLQRWQEETQKVLHQPLPPVLAPVRAYLLESMLLPIESEQVRYEYLRSSDTRPMRRLLCREGDCGPAEESLLAQLRDVTDPAMKLVLSEEWAGQVRERENKTHPPAYPMEAWQSFLREFAIMEKRDEGVRDALPCDVR